MPRNKPNTRICPRVPTHKHNVPRSGRLKHSSNVWELRKTTHKQEWLYPRDPVAFPFLFHRVKTEEDIEVEDLSLV